VEKGAMKTTMAWAKVERVSDVGLYVSAFLFSLTLTRRFYCAFLS
jgi:hypothetical protein